MPPPSQRAAATTESRPGFQSAHLRPVVSRFGGMIQESNAIHIPLQTWERPIPGASDKDFDARYKAQQKNVYAGVPGYMGHKPHGSHTSAYMGETSAPKPHNQKTSSLDTSKQPYVMPVVGYSGHLRLGKQSFGTSHWKNSGSVTENKAAANKPWDGRDSAGRPFGGQIPCDGGLYVADPEEDQKRKEAEEANELLELRSLGIRALIAKSPEVRESRSRTRTPEEALSRPCLCACLCLCALSPPSDAPASSDCLQQLGGSSAPRRPVRQIGW
jgi:hypothetical protein